VQVWSVRQNFFLFLEFIFLIKILVRFLSFLESLTEKLILPIFTKSPPIISLQFHMVFLNESIGGFLFEFALNLLNSNKGDGSKLFFDEQLISLCCDPSLTST
jgi:hypothetical protein